MPDRPANCPEEIPPDVADAPVCDGLLPPLPTAAPQVPDKSAPPDVAIPAVPPPSKTGLEPDIPDALLPVDAVLPVAEQLGSNDVPDGSGLMPPGWDFVG